MFLLFHRPVARIFTRGIMAMVTLLSLFEKDNGVPTVGLPSNKITLNTSLVEGIYDYHSSENFDAYLEELGVSWYLRDLAAIAAPVVSISRKNDTCSRYVSTK